MMILTDMNTLGGGVVFCSDLYCRFLCHTAVTVMLCYVSKTHFAMLNAFWTNCDLKKYKTAVKHCWLLI